MEMRLIIDGQATDWLDCANWSVNQMLCIYEAIRVNQAMAGYQIEYRTKM